VGKIKIMLKKLTKPAIIGVVALFVSIIIIISTSWTLYNHTVNILTQNLRERLITISTTQAVNINAKDLEVLLVENDWKKPEWAHVVNQLHKAKYNNSDVVFMYIFRYTKDPYDDSKKMEFVADADSIDPYANTSGDPSRYVDSNRDGKIEPDGPDKLQWPGQPDPDTDDIPEAHEAYYGPITVKDLYTDEYGTVLTGYAPIVDNSGNVVAILGTDIKADDFFIITRQTLQPFLVFIVALTLVISILILIIISSWKKYVGSLEKLNIKIEAANKGQLNLIHIVNHQIKGYMTKAMLAFDALLTDTDYGPISEPAQSLIKEGYGSVTEGINFVTDFLNASNIEQGTYHYDIQPVDFQALVEAVVDKKRSQAEEKGLSFELSIDGGQYVTHGDKTQLEQVIRNLADNAIRYTPQGSVKLQLSIKDQKILLTIIDTGVGISNELKPQLFTKGGRDKDSLKINVNSTGYGLSFAKDVVEAHHGHVWAESDGVNKGSTFYMELPVNSN
jgi:signal transduction histidine kinase